MLRRPKPQPHDKLEEERVAISAAGRLHWFHWVVVGLSLAATLGAWQITKRQAEEKVRDQFDRAVEQTVSLIEERMQKYEDALWGGVAAVRAQGDDMTYADWVIFSESLRLEERYPGINGIGLIHHVLPEELDAYLAEQRRARPAYTIHPTHGEDEYLPITYIEPADINAAAVGLDMAHEANRYFGVLRSRDTGTAQITAPITLVQDELHTPGFLFYAPWYAEGEDSDLDARQANFRGVVYAPFVVRTLLDGTLAEANRAVGIRISDGSDVLYDEHQPSFDDYDPDPAFRQVVPVVLYGREWEFDIWSAKSFQELTHTREPLVILLGGLLLDALLLSLFVVLSRSNRRAINFADEVSAALRSESERLAESNAELEQFAYVASHDLKTPLRGIQHLTEYLEDDLEEHLGPEASPDVSRNISRIREQTGRMSDLIDGILAHARIGRSREMPSWSTVNVNDFVAKVGQDLELSADQLRYEGPSTVTVPAAVYFEQILQNLLANAASHHDDRATAHIEVTCRRSDDRLRITVSDDGPGIEPDLQERIFEPFQTGGTRTAGTGVGLSIVRKVLDLHGCSVTVRSTPGEGAVFEFDWAVEPDHVADRDGPSPMSGPRTPDAPAEYV